MTEWRYADQILFVDLSAQASWTEPTPLQLKRSLVGGAGFVAGLLASVAPGAVAMACGPLSDGMAGRLSLGGRSDGRVALSSLGGRMAASVKECGYDAVVLMGPLDEPGYLTITAENVSVHRAGDLWGLEIPEANRALVSQVGRTFASMVLGPAAENGVPFATLAHEGHFAGGGGVAALLGAMRLKAILVSEAKEIPSRCEGCHLACPNKLGDAATRAGALGLDAPTAARLAALAEGCARAGLLPLPDEPLADMAFRRGALGELLAAGEDAALARLGPAAEPIAAALPPVKRRRGPGVADLLGTCQRVWRDRPGQVLREALTNTLGLLTT